MTLCDMQCRSAKGRAKNYKLYDEQGLYLEITPRGLKSWRLRYHIFQKERRISIGPYPAVSLHEARKKRDSLREDIRSGRDPAFERKQKLQSELLQQSQTFSAMALEWHGKQVEAWSDDYAQKVKHRLEKYAFPFFGEYPLFAIKPMLVLQCLQKVEKTAPEMSRRVKAYCSHIFKYAIATGRAETDPTYGLEAALKKFRKGHYASVSVDEFPDFLFTLHEYRDRVKRQTFLALKMLMLTFVRTNELVEAKWAEFDFENAMWVIPAERMKMRSPHMVPLSKQALQILTELKDVNGHREFVLTSYSRPRNPMSKNTMLVAIKRMGYNGKMTGHGFRALAMGLLKEKLGYVHDVVNRQLAHVPKNNVDRAYDRAQFLVKRTEMMQSYADYIDQVYLQKLAEQMSK